MMNDSSQRGDNAVCPVCPRHCALAPGQVGFCRARCAHGGRVVPQNYGRITSLALDPIEKKPLARFHPGKMILSVGSYGCNLRCFFCQNYEISQTDEEIRYQEWEPRQLVDRAVSLVSSGNMGIAFTYNEPGVGYEFVRDAAALAREEGLLNVMVSNGYLCPEPLEQLLQVVDGFNIDLKCFSEEGYRRLGGGLETVKQSIAAIAPRAHLEVTTLVVPGLSDDALEMEAQARWLAGISPEIPLHLSRYFPRWQSDLPATSPHVLDRLAKIARRHLQHVYLGNV